MTIDTSSKNLAREAQNAKETRDDYLGEFSLHRARFHGPAYSKNGRGGRAESDGPGADFYPENHFFEYVSLVVPRIIYDNPRVRVSTRRPGTQASVATAIRHGLNRWVRDENLRRLLTPVAVDTLFNWGVVLVTQQPNPGSRPSENRWRMDEEGFSRVSSEFQWPKAYRISQERFFMDPLALTREEVRFMGHSVVRDKEDLLEEARSNPDLGWDVAALEELTEDVGLDDLERDPAHTDVDRNEISFDEIYIMDYELDDSPGPSEGFHGTIFTIASKGGGKRGEDVSALQLREPRPFYGPPVGPYVVYGVYTVPDSPWPLSPMVAVSGQVDEVNVHANAVSKSAESFKSGIIVPDPKLQQLIASGPHQTVFASGGTDKDQLFPFTVGGADPSQINYLEYVKDRLNKVSGLDDAQRGNVKGVGTATEVAVADEAAAARMDFIKEQFQDATGDLLERIAWYLYHDDRVMFPLGPDAAAETNMVEPWFAGGSFEDGSGASFRDLELEIEAYSMERTTEVMQQRRITEIMNFLMNVAPIIPQTPYIDWPDVIDQFGENLNIPNMGRFIDTDMAYQMAGMQAPGPQPGSNEPQLVKNLGGVGVLNRFLDRAHQGDGAQSPTSKQVAGPSFGREVSESIR